MNFKIAYLDKLWYFLVYALALFPVLPRGVESILMISLFVVSLIVFLIQKDRMTITRENIITVAILSIVFFLYTVGLTYSQNIAEGLKFIIRVLPIIAFPMIFGIFNKNKLDKVHLNYIFNLYVLSLLLNTIFVQAYLFFKVDISIISNWDYRKTFEELTDVHGTYYSLWLSFGSLILLHKAIEALVLRKTIVTILLITIMSYFIYWQIVIGARLPFIITLILLTILLIVKTKSKKIVFTSLLLFAIFICLIIFMRPNYLNKIKELTKYDFSLPEGDYHVKQGEITSEQIRNGIYYCSIELAKKNWLIGYGIGDVDEELEYCYKSKIKSNVYQVFKFNTHNQYVHFLLSSGIIGLLLFLTSLLLPLLMAYKSSNSLFIVFSILIIISLFTENVLSRHDGILFYSFFNSIFVFLSKNKLKQ